MMLAALMVLAAQADGGVRTKLAPADAMALRAAGKACVGATVDPAGQNARLAGWVDASPAQRGDVKSDGRVLTRDNVLLMVKPGLDGGCVAMATVDPAFDKAAFYAGLGKDLGTTIVTDPKNPVTPLSNGEVLVTILTPEGDKLRAMLVVGNPDAKPVKNKGKNP